MGKRRTCAKCGKRRLCTLEYTVKGKVIWVCHECFAKDVDEDICA